MEGRVLALVVVVELGLNQRAAWPSVDGAISVGEYGLRGGGVLCGRRARRSLAMEGCVLALIVVVELSLNWRAAWPSAACTAAASCAATASSSATSVEESAAAMARNRIAGAVASRAARHRYR